LEESDEEAQCEEGVPSLHCELSNGEDGEDAKLEGKPAVYTCEGGEVNVLV
jgi:ligand-binding sensor protein